MANNRVIGFAVAVGLQWQMTQACHFAHRPNWRVTGTIGDVPIELNMFNYSGTVDQCKIKCCNTPGCKGFNFDGSRCFGTSRVSIHPYVIGARCDHYAGIRAGIASHADSWDTYDIVQANPAQSISINMEGKCDTRNEALAHLYCIDVTDKTTGKTVRVFHRYTDFRELRKNLLGKRAIMNEAPFPLKMRPCFSTQCEEWLSAGRRALLWEWLKELIQESGINRGIAPLVTDFLQPGSKQHKSKSEKAKDWLKNAKNSVVGAVKAALAPSVGGAALGAEALVVIDVQHCFTNGETSDGKRVKSKRGEGDLGLQSPRGDKAWKASVVDYVAQWMSRKQPIVLLQDFHPDKHVSFITGGPGEEKWNPTDNIRSRMMGESVFFSSNSGQVAKKEANFQKMQYDAPVFPSHCVKGTEEAKLIDGLCEAVGGVYDKDFACKVDADKYPNVKVVQKGTNTNIDSFGGIYDNRMGYITELQGFASRELAERSSWGVLEWLNSKGVKSVETIGIADDYCVKTTALDLANKQQAEMANAIAIPHVVINPQYTYGIAAQLWEKDDVGHGVTKLYENLIGDLYQSKLEGNGVVEVKRQPAKEEL